MSKWIKCKDRLPEEDGLYLIADIVIADVITYHTRYFAHDLHKVDDIDFADYKGVSGWYYYDDEYGYYECDAEAWVPIEPYSRKTEEGAKMEVIVDTTKAVYKERIVRCRECRKKFSCVIFEGIANEDGFCSLGVAEKEGD